MERFKRTWTCNAKLEPWTIANSWNARPATGQIISPTRHVLTLETRVGPPARKAPFAVR